MAQAGQGKDQNIGISVMAIWIVAIWRAWIESRSGHESYCSVLCAVLFFFFSLSLFKDEKKLLSSSIFSLRVSMCVCVFLSFKIVEQQNNDLFPYNLRFNNKKIFLSSDCTSHTWLESVCDTRSTLRWIEKIVLHVTIHDCNGINAFLLFFQRLLISLALVHPASTFVY